MTVATAKDLIPAGSHREMEELLKLDLDEKSTVVIIGGYKGRTANLLLEAYSCKMFLFDPQEWMNNHARKLLGDRATVFDYGLADKEGTFPMVEFGTDAATFHLESSKRQPGEGKVRDVIKVWKEQKFDDVGLVLLNCEGSEFGILERLYEEELLRNSSYFLIQFHLASVKGNGINYGIWLSRLNEVGFDVIWSIGAPWTLFRRMEIGGIVEKEELNGEAQEQTREREETTEEGQQEVEERLPCGFVNQDGEACPYVPPSDKSYPHAMRAHKRSH